MLKELSSYHPVIVIMKGTTKYVDYTYVMGRSCFPCCEFSKAKLNIWLQVIAVDFYKACQLQLRENVLLLLTPKQAL